MLNVLLFWGTSEVMVKINSTSQSVVKYWCFGNTQGLSNCIDNCFRWQTIWYFHYDVDQVKNGFSVQCAKKMKTVCSVRIKMPRRYLSIL